jgi:hypothetical protein
MPQEAISHAGSHSTHCRLDVGGEDRVCRLGFRPLESPTRNPAKPPFFIDTARGAWGINVPADTIDMLNYDAAWISFTGDGYLHPLQTFSTTVLFTIPGPYYGAGYGIVPTPTEGVGFFAQSATIPSAYDTFGHQVLGIYLGPTANGPQFSLAVHSTQGRHW